MSLIAFVGDCHYHFYEMYVALAAWQLRTGSILNAIVHVGDFGVDKFNPQWAHLWDVDKQVPIETHICLGNHENYESVKKWQAEPDRIAHLHLLPDGGVTDIAGVKVASVWGNYSPKSWMNPDIVKCARNLSVPGSLKALHIYRPSVFKLLDYEGPVDVLVTHDCSTAVMPLRFKGKPVPEGLRAVLGLDKDELVPPGCPGFTQLLDKFKPTYHFYGHMHVRDDQEREGTKVICLNAFDFNQKEAVEIVAFK